LEIRTTNVQGVALIQPKVYSDSRGYFLETWQSQRYKNAGIPTLFLQDNISKSVKGVLRGLHFQWPQPQGKLVTVLEGEVLDVIVDIRKNSPTFGMHVTEVLSGEKKNQIYAPEGCAHGFLVLSEIAVFSYKCTAIYAPQHEHTLLWSDLQLNINWGIKTPILSQKDSQGMSFTSASNICE
jgi:dTDP-4-dehydrorhamnose 3,5-epimerase